MKMILVLGAEGTGHHMLWAVLREFLDHPKVVHQGERFPIVRNAWDICEESFPYANGNVFEEMLDRYESEGTEWVYEDTSIPFNLPRTPLRRMDILKFVERVAPRCDLKIVLLYRNPILSVNSCIRRGFSRNLLLEAKICEDSHIYIASQMRALGPMDVRLVEYENWIKDPKRHVEDLVQWLQIQTFLAGDCASRIRERTPLESVPTETQTYLDEFFSSRRLSQWEPVYRSFQSSMDD